MTLSLTELRAGHAFTPAHFTVTAANARAYRDAVRDTLTVYADAGGVVPPLAVAALALGELLRQVALPPGSLHASESVECMAAVLEGEKVECRARLSQRSIRGGWVVSVLESDLAVNGITAVTARATVLSPAEPS